MALFNRLIGTEEPKLSVHAFAAVIFDYVAGEVTRAEIISAFGITAAEEAALDTVLAKVDGLANATAKKVWCLELENVLILGEGGYRYTTQASAANRLGV